MINENLHRSYAVRSIVGYLGPRRPPSPECRVRELSPGDNGLTTLLRHCKTSYQQSGNFQ